ncbi:kinase-like domain-containing protein [Suillus ampliporus]|nr:kinase-like domain-containing protein [Suillus ampliporus]
MTDVYNPWNSYMMFYIDDRTRIEDGTRRLLTIAYGTVKSNNDSFLKESIKPLVETSEGADDIYVDHGKLAQESRLKDEKIVPLLGIASGFGPDNSFSMVSTWFTNGTLTSFLVSQHNALCGGRRMELVHTSEVVHSDLSGNNVLINDRGKACLTDFGFQGALYLGQVGRPGAIRWAAPELIVGLGQHSTFESDIYSFGCIMLQVLVEHIIIQKLTNGQVPRRPSSVSSTHWAFIQKCWSPSPRNSTRPSSRPSASEVVEYLKNSGIHIWRSPDSTLRCAAGSVIRWITAITSPELHYPAESGSDGISPVLNHSSSNRSIVHGNTESSIDVIPGENIINRAFVHKDTRNKDSDLEDLNERPIISQDVNTNQQNSQASATSEPLASSETGTFGDIWQCHLHTADSGTVHVAVQALQRFDTRQPDVRKKLFRKHLIWLKLEHRNIVHFYGMTSSFSVFPAFVTAWMPNGTITEYLDKQHPYLMTRHRFCLIYTVHSHNIVHGNLTGECRKPTPHQFNVFIDESGRACLTDYDLTDIIANMETSSMSAYASVARWAAPELILEGSVESQNSEDMVPSPKMSADVYSFGCIMLQCIEILVGRLPYWWIRHSTHVIVAKYRGVLPMEDGPDVPKLDECHKVFLQRCWENPHSRPWSAEAAEFVTAELRRLDEA